MIIVVYLTIKHSILKYMYHAYMCGTHFGGRYMYFKLAQFK